MAGKFILVVDGSKVSEQRGIELVAGTNVTLTVTETEGDHIIPQVEIAATGAGGAPTDADYLVGTTNGSLSGEIVVGTSPGGELGGTWASPTVDATHSGSAHHAQSHGNADHTSVFIVAADVTYENLSANGDVGTGATQVSQGDHSHAGGSVATDAIWDAAGDLAVGTGANTAARLALGSDGNVLTVSGGTASWQPAGAGSHPGYATHAKFGVD